jgi:hypothetical protein
VKHCTRRTPLCPVARVRTTLGDTVGMFQPVALDTLHTESPWLVDSSLPVEAGRLECPQAYCILSPSTLLPTLGEACFQSVSPTIEPLRYSLAHVTVVVLSLYTPVAGICWDQRPSSRLLSCCLRSLFQFRDYPQQVVLTLTGSRYLLGLMYHRFFLTALPRCELDVADSLPPPACVYSLQCSD